MHMKQFRRRRGAALGLVAAAVLVLAIVGIAFFILSRIMGGGREVTNATDAGILNVAKQAMTVGTPVPMEFARCTVPENSDVTLMTYNRLVAQALHVAMNADAQGMGQGNAAATWSEVEKIGADLKTKLDDNPTTRDFFKNISTANNTKMWGDRVIPNRLQQAFMKRGGSTNVYMDVNSFPFNTTQNPPQPVTPPANLYSAGPLNTRDGKPYMRGYEAISAAGLDIFGVPVFPGVNPHLVNNGEFDSSVNPPDESVPPNSWKVNSASKEKTTNRFGGAVASAIVGAVLQEDGVSQFQGGIPGGYIEIYNWPGKSSPYTKANNMDASKGVFNTQLYEPPGIFVSNNVNQSPLAALFGALQGLIGAIASALGLGQDPDKDKANLFNQGNGIFTTNQAELQAWLDYNKSSGTDSRNKDGNLFPPDHGFPLDSTSLRYGSQKDQKPSLDDCLQITDIVDQPCWYMNYDDGYTGLCANNLVNFIGNYGTGISSGAGDNGGFMNLEVTKANVLEELFNGEWCAAVQVPVQGGKSGLKKFGHDTAYPAPPVKFSEDASPYELLVQVDSCSWTRGGTFDQIYQRCCQILPGVSRGRVTTLLQDPKIPMGTTLYIYKVGSDLAMNTSKPPTYSGVAPDGPLPDQTSAAPCMVSKYDSYGLQVNTSGDANLHDRPYMGATSDGIFGVDRALWQTSSGHKNLLGRLEFSNDVEGGGNMCSPN